MRHRSLDRLRQPFLSDRSSREIPFRCVCGYEQLKVSARNIKVGAGFSRRTLRYLRLKHRCRRKQTMPSDCTILKLNSGSFDYVIWRTGSQDQSTAAKKENLEFFFECLGIPDACSLTLSLEKRWCMKLAMNITCREGTLERLMLLIYAQEIKKWTEWTLSVTSCNCCIWTSFSLLACVCNQRICSETSVYNLLHSQSTFSSDSQTPWSILKTLQCARADFLLQCKCIKNVSRFCSYFAFVNTFHFHKK